MGNSYTKGSLMIGERIIYSAKLHYFSFFGSVVLVIIGFMMLDIISFSDMVNKIDEDSARKIKGEIHQRTNQAKGMLGGLKESFENIIDSLPDEFKSIIAFMSKVRLYYFGIIFASVGFINFLRIYLNKISSEYVITNKRVVYKFGFVSVDSIEINIDRIEGVKVKRNVTDRIVGRGNVLINSIGFEQIEIKKIAQPERFRNTLLDTIQKFVDTRK